MTFELSDQPVVAVRAQLRARNIIIRTFIRMEVVDSNVAIRRHRPQLKLAKIIYVILQRSVLCRCNDTILRGVSYYRVCKGSFLL